MYEFEFRSDPITGYGVSCPWASEKYFHQVSSAIFIQIFLILAHKQNWHNILSFWIYSWSLFQVQSYLTLIIVNYGVSKHYAGSQMSDHCPLGYLFYCLAYLLWLFHFDADTSESLSYWSWKQKPFDNWYYRHQWYVVPFAKASWNQRSEQVTSSTTVHGFKNTIDMILSGNT